MAKINVMIVDDHEMVRRGLRAYLETEEDFALVGEASGGDEAVRKAKELRPDVILMDLVMENGNGIVSTERIVSVLPLCKIIILTSYYDDEKVFPAIEAGAFSYLLKTAPAEEIAAAIRKAADGEAVIESKVAGKMMTKMRGAGRQLPHDDLTNREREVLVLLGEGKTNKEIADELYIGLKTVKTHVSHILHKLQVSDRTQAAIYANRHNLKN
ncbi:MAG TPA: response regulator transcription factor [Bacillales bacterium]|nr:response regulator transcription factor [Bacillales bacterium]